MLQIGAALLHYKLRQTLSKMEAALLLQIRTSVVTNWGIYYKLAQLLLQQLLQIGTGITNFTGIFKTCSVSFILHYLDITKPAGIIFSKIIMMLGLFWLSRNHWEDICIHNLFWSLRVLLQNR